MQIPQDKINYIFLMKMIKYILNEKHCLIRFHISFTLIYPQSDLAHIPNTHKKKMVLIWIFQTLCPFLV